MEKGQGEGFKKNQEAHNGFPGFPRQVTPQPTGKYPENKIWNGVNDPKKGEREGRSRTRSRSPRR